MRGFAQHFAGRSAPISASTLTVDLSFRYRPLIRMWATSTFHWTSNAANLFFLPPNVEVYQQRSTNTISLNSNNDSPTGLNPPFVWAQKRLWLFRSSFPNSLGHILSWSSSTINRFSQLTESNYLQPIEPHNYFSSQLWFLFLHSFPNYSFLFKANPYSRTKSLF